MKLIMILLLLQFWVFVFLNTSVYCQRPSVVHVGAVFTSNSVIGRAAKATMEAAVSDINSDQSILNGTELKLIMEDANCSVFLGSIKAFQVIEREVVAIIGPQSSSIAHMISHISSGLQLPLISYAASDPTLASLQFPYFLRTTQTDSYQMAAMADLIDFYGWKEIIAIYIDDEYGRNGISSLSEELVKKSRKISYKFPLPTQFDLSDITYMLNETKKLGPRVYVVHINPDPALRIFGVAQKLHMMTSDYVWLATDWLCATLDSFSPKTSGDLLKSLQGVLGFRQYIPETSQKKGFVSRWRKMQENGTVHSGLNVYGFYAYDTMWVVAKSIDKFLNDRGNMTFSFNDELHKMQVSELKFGKLKVFDGGNLLLKILLETNFTGLTGKIQFNSDRNLVIGGYEVVNIVNMAIQTVGYWSNYSGLSVLPLETLGGEQMNYTRSDQKLESVVWPGEKTEMPRGWVIADNERPLRIGVPYRASFVEFATLNTSHEIQGYCIDVFNEARNLIPYNVPYRFVPVGDGRFNPNYNELVKKVADNVFDAAVGDIAIVTNRTMIVDFTQPYAATGLVIVAPMKNSKSSAWVFLKPFTVEMWCATAASFMMIAVVIWILEHRVNDDFRGPPRRQLITMFLFSFSTLFKTNQENTVSALGRFVMVVWLFILLIITSSYTASLTSILTVQQLSSSITGIDSLVTSDWPIGYQVGSFAFGYLTDCLSIHPSRLKVLASPEEYERALRQGPSNGGVAAIVDELPYVELFLSKQTDFGIIGQSFTRSGWGFAFQKDSPLAVDMSTAILKLSESGELQKIHEKWFCKKGCAAEKTRKSEPNKLHMSSFWGLYVLCGGFTITALLVFFVRTVRQYIKYKRNQTETSFSSSSVSSNTHSSHLIYSFFGFIDKKEEVTKNTFSHRDNAQPQAT